jgi:Zn-dependent M28 family amino/carboxypeptidase
VKRLVEALCADDCAGRAPGTDGGRRARALVVEALRARGLAVDEQPIPRIGGANLLAALPGSTDRWVLVAAHYDHLGTHGGEMYRGADDNAAAVAILVEVAGALARERPDGRGVLIAAFDSEEPPHFLSPAMGSMYFVHHPTVPLDRIDLMICMDLMGHALGPVGLPAEVRDTLFAFGAERSAGTAAHVDALARAVPGLIVRRADAETLPPLSDYAGFWDRAVPFLFLTNGRSAIYHTPDDTPDRLDYPKMAATARWLERLVRETCARPESRIEFLARARDDASTLRSFIALATALDATSPYAAVGRQAAEQLLAACDAEGKLAQGQRREMQALIMQLEAAMA